MKEKENKGYERSESVARLGVFEETAPLKKVLMWGAPGTEAVLAQLIPKKASLFEQNFDVMAARREFDNTITLLENNNVEVILVKDLFAQMVKSRRSAPSVSLKELLEKSKTRGYLPIGRENVGESLTLNELSYRLKKKGYDYYKKYQGRDTASLDVLDWIDPILKEDAERYGENSVSASINKTLSLDAGLPPGNILYARDQSNLLGNTFVWSSMRKAIRKFEVQLYKDVMMYSGLLEEEGLSIVEVQGNGRFEGGDGIANNGFFYIGVGGRTNLEGAVQVAKQILADGRGKVMIPYDEERDTERKNEMDAMHLDTIWMPSDINEVVACGAEIERRKLLEVVLSNGNIKIKERGWFIDHLANRGVDLVPLTKEEQIRYAPNFLNLGNKTVILSLAKNSLTDELTKRGKKVLNADLENITKGYGGLHCMTASILRK